MENTKRKTTKSPDEIPENFDSYEAAAKFWDSHDVADYLDLTEEVPNIQIKLSRKYFRIKQHISARLSPKAREKGISSETLLNLWL